MKSSRPPLPCPRLRHAGGNRPPQQNPEQVHPCRTICSFSVQAWKHHQNAGVGADTLKSAPAHILLPQQYKMPSDIFWMYSLQALWLLQARMLQEGLEGGDRPPWERALLGAPPHRSVKDRTLPCTKTGKLPCKRLLGLLLTAASCYVYKVVSNFLHGCEMLFIYSGAV